VVGWGSVSRSGRSGAAGVLCCAGDRRAAAAPPAIRPNPAFVAAPVSPVTAADSGAAGAGDGVGAFVDDAPRAAREGETARAAREGETACAAREGDAPRAGGHAAGRAGVSSSL
jgi:hypothetical protein